MRRRIKDFRRTRPAPGTRAAKIAKRIPTGTPGAARERPFQPGRIPTRAAVASKRHASHSGNVTRPRLLTQPARPLHNTPIHTRPTGLQASFLATLYTMKLLDLAAALGCELRGDPAIEITGVAGMEHAGPQELTFLANPKYAHKVKNTRAAAILVAQPIDGLPIASLLSSNPYLDFARALALFYQPPRPAPGIHPLAAIAPSARIGEGACIGPFAVIGEGVSIGRNAILHPHVVIYEGAEIGDDFYAHSGAVVREYCRIGHRVILQNNVVIGGDGFGFAKRADGSHFKIVQSGIAVIEDDVEIQSLSSVDRATIGETRVQRGAKVDNLVQIGHACVVGEDNIICAQVGLAGSSVLKRNVLLAGQVGVAGHLTIHDNAIVYAQSGVGNDVKPGSVISGSPAFDSRDWLRAVTAFPKVPDLLKTVRELEKRLAKLENGAAKAMDTNE